MVKKLNHLSDRSLLALYMALCAARKRTSKIVISNQVLKQYFFGNEPGKPLSERQISNWAEALKPILPRHAVKRTQGGPYLVLYLNATDDASLKIDSRQSIPHRETVNKTLGVVNADS
jgi:hypothetical protein